MTLTPEESERFWAKVEQRGECWEWTASTRNGYGQFSVNRHPRYAHRVAYEAMVADIPEGLVIDHLCRNTRCVNPYHLEPVTKRENAIRSPIVTDGGPRLDRRLSVCAKGLHDMSEAIANGGQRTCGPCRREYMSKYDAQRRGQSCSRWGKGKKLLSPTVEVR